MVVAAGMVLVGRSRRFGDLVPGESVTLGLACLRRAGRRGLLLRSLLAIRIGRGLLWALQRRVLPGLFLHFALRKRAIDAMTREAVSAGARRAVVLGAGFDALSLRLARQGVQAVEVDHPGTQRLKMEAVRELGLLHEPEFVAADLGRGLPEAVLADGPTVYIAEGLLMYLDPAQVGGLLTALGGAAPGSVLILTFLNPRPDGKLGFPRSGRIVSAWLRSRGEPFRWGASFAEVREMLSRAGFEGARLVELGALREAKGVSPEAFAAAGERVCVAKKR